MTAPVDLEELKRLLAKATLGPWHVQQCADEQKLPALVEGEKYQEVVAICVESGASVCMVSQPFWRADVIQANAAIVSALRNAAPALIEELEALREFYDAHFISGHRGADAFKASYAHLQELYGRT